MKDIRIKYDFIQHLWKIVELKDGLVVAVLFECKDLDKTKQKLEELT